jgi:hypothetical protein
MEEETLKSTVDDVKVVTQWPPICAFCGAYEEIDDQGFPITHNSSCVMCYLPTCHLPPQLIHNQLVYPSYCSEECEDRYWNSD